LAVSRPTLGEIVSRVQGDINGKLEGVSARLRWKSETVLGYALAGLSHLLFGRIDWLSKQIIPNPEMDDEFADKWAAMEFSEPDDLLIGIPPGRKPASPAEGNLQITGTTSAHLDAGSEVIRVRDGAVFTTDASYTWGSNATVAIAVTAKVGGEAGNTDAGEKFLISNPVAGIQSSCTVGTGGLTGGTERESTPALVDRINARIQTPQRSGAPGDYAQWAKRVPGVTRAWEVARAAGPGTVYVYILSDSNSGIAASDELVATTQAYLETKRPVTAKGVTVFSGLGHAINLTIHLVNDTTANRNAVLAELNDLLLLAGTGDQQSVSRQDLLDAIRAAAAGSLSVPSGDVSLLPGEAATIGTVTWV
jgi:uncharacterized phage protein gp47/JayE